MYVDRVLYHVKKVSHMQKIIDIFLDSNKTVQVKIKIIIKNKWGMKGQMHGKTDMFGETSKWPGYSQISLLCPF